MDSRARLSRRDFLLAGLAVCGLAGCGPVSPRIQTREVARLGYLAFSTADPALGVMLGRLRDLGWRDGETLAVEPRSAEGSYEQLPALAAELVGRGVDVIATATQTGALAAKRATDTIPIVFAGIGDPVGGGVVESLARPGGNVTGTSSLVEGLSPKLLELLQDAVPGLARVAVLWNPGVARVHWDAIRAAAPQRGVALLPLEVHEADQLAGAFTELDGRPADGLVVLPAATFFAARERVLALATQRRLPAVYPFADFATAGGLLAYAASLPALHRRAAEYIDRVLRGARPADLPVEQPTTFDLVVNLGTARSLGLSIPPTVLQQATEVIQ